MSFSLPHLLKSFLITPTIDGCEKRPYTSLCTVRLENCSLVWGRDKNFSLCYLVHTGSGVQPVVYPVGTGGFPQECYTHYCCSLIIVSYLKKARKYWGNWKLISECCTQIMREVSQRMKIIYYKNEICKYLQSNFGDMCTCAQTHTHTLTRVHRHTHTHKHKT
jgi:hypothetical protein